MNQILAFHQMNSHTQQHGEASFSVFHVIILPKRNIPLEEDKNLEMGPHEHKHSPKHIQIYTHNYRIIRSFPTVTESSRILPHHNIHNTRSPSHLVSNTQTQVSSTQTRR